jgi:cellulose synthase/poly-beta-1,6-N-acetylglucosamine synthase-like glycosyltransferase
VRDHGGLDGIMSTHLMVVLTMYNEDAGELRGTLCALQRAFEYLFSREERRVRALSAEVRRAMKEGLDAGGAVEDNGSVSPAEGRRRWCNAVATGQAWRQVVVCIVSDGKTKIHPSSQEYLGKLGLFDRSAMHLCSLGLEPSLHLFEKTVRPKFLRLDREIAAGDIATCPMQGILALKEHNAGKLDSHRWAFNGLAPQLKPRYLMTLDVGTMPTPEAVYRLLRAMERNPQVRTY